MKRLIPAFLFGAFLISPAIAQNSNPERQAAEHERDFVARELLLRQLAEQPGRAQLEVAQRREAQYREKQFIEKTNRFVQLWCRFVAEYNGKKAFNMKVAKEISTAFHELETSEGW